jgi:4'-phosphopantetheinyl transferase
MWSILLIMDRRWAMVSNYQLDRREVRVWPIKLYASHECIAQFRSLLSSEELHHVDQLRFPRLQRHYVMSQSVLRILLSRLLKVPARQLSFAFGKNGKPALAGPTRIHFNMSHSDGLALYAVTIDCSVGVDVERIRSIEDFQQIASSYFHPAELANLVSLPSSDRPAAFFRCWTRKEAYIKAMGDGLTIPLDTFQVTLRPDQPARFAQCLAALGWNLHHLDPAPGYVGALAYQDSPRTLILEPIVTAQELLIPFQVT